MSEDVYYTEGLTLPETPPPSTDPPDWGTTNIVGQPLPRVDGYERLSGAAIYPSDVILPGMLHGALLRCPHPHARLVSLDIGAAERLDGVHAVIHRDTPEAAAVRIEHGSGLIEALFAEECLYEGAPVAAVAAESPYRAADALRALNPQWEVLPQVVDHRDAQAPDAPNVQPEGNRLGEPQVYERGDVERGFSEADAVVEREYATACQLHTPMELHGAVASWDGPNLTVWESTQGVFSVQEQLANLLDIPLSRVRVIGHYMGGGFGSKLKTDPYAVCAALLAAKTARPVKIFVSREETMLAYGNRPANTMRVTLGARRDGRLTAIEFEGAGSGGAFNGGTGILDWIAKDLYTCDNVRTELTDWVTHTGATRPFRAPGHPQGAWALEQAMDELAEELGLDPVELRLRNVPTVSQARDGLPYTTTGLAECLREGAATFDWEGRRREIDAANAGQGPIKRGMGMAACLWVAGGGGPPASAMVTVFRDGSVSLEMGAADIGTGTKTVMAQVVAEELGVRPETIRIANADTGTTPYSTASGGSKTVPSDSPAVRDAAIHAKQQLLEMAARELSAPIEELVYAGRTIHHATDASRSVTVAEMNGLRRRRSVVGVGHRGPNPEETATCPFSVHFCEVSVDTRTGEVRVERFLGAHDSGRVMNRLTYDSQVIGGITMGIGFGLTEERVLDRGQTGKLCNRSWHDYKLPTALDVPAEIVSLPIELDASSANTTGAKGLGEPVTIPTAAALANAVYDACGVRVTETPISPIRLAALLAAQREEGSP